MDRSEPNKPARIDEVTGSPVPNDLAAISGCSFHSVDCRDLASDLKTSASFGAVPKQDARDTAVVEPEGLVPAKELEWVVVVPSSLLEGLPRSSEACYHQT